MFAEYAVQLPVRQPGHTGAEIRHKVQGRRQISIQRLQIISSVAADFLKKRQTLDWTRSKDFFVLVFRVLPLQG
jgi:hypothetical protein